VGDTIEKYAGYLLAILVTVLGVFMRRDLARFDKGLERLAELERVAVTEEKLDRILAQLRGDRLQHHAENRSSLVRIETKLDAQEERSSKARHDIRDQVHACSLRLASVEAQLPAIANAAAQAAAVAAVEAASAS
jgi:hypothetical protein